MTEPLGLAFVDTLDLRLSDAIESLHDYADLVTWAEATGAVTPTEAVSLRTAAAGDPAAADAALRAALSLREAGYRVLVARLDRRAPDPRDVTVLDEHLGRSRERLVVADDGAVGVTRTSEGPPLEALLGPVAVDLARLLVDLEADLRT